MRRWSALLLVLHGSTHAWQPHTGALHRSVVGRATTPCASADACGPLQRVVHRVEDQEAVGRFYESCVGLEPLPCPPSNKECMVVGKSEDALCLELVSGSATQYVKLCARVPSVDDAVERVRKWCADADDKAAVLSEPETIEHTASLIPEQPEEAVTPVRQATVSDPSGASVLLWEVGGEESESGGATLTGAHLEVYEWKKSQTWYEQNLGWSTLRHQSNVPLEAAITITVGAPGGEPGGVWGAEAEAATGGVLLLHYAYGTAKIQQPDGLVALVVARPMAGALDTTDPDGYPVMLTAGDDA